MNLLKGSWRTSVLGVCLILLAVLKFLVATLDGDPKTNIAPADLAESIVAGWALLMARDNRVSSEQAGAIAPTRSSGPPAGVGLLILLVLSSVGCAKFAGYTERKTKDVTEITRFRGFTFMDAEASLAKAKALQTDKTQSVGVDTSAQESTGKTISDVAKEALPLLKKSVVP